jgi:hypothetical protein
MADLLPILEGQGLRYRLKVPDGFGYVVLVFDHQGTIPYPTQLCCSNLDEDSMIRHLQELVDSWKAKKKRAGQ